MCALGGQRLSSGGVLRNRHLVFGGKVSWFAWGWFGLSGQPAGPRGPGLPSSRIATSCFQALLCVGVTGNHSGPGHLCRASGMCGWMWGSGS